MRANLKISEQLFKPNFVLETRIVNSVPKALCREICSMCETYRRKRLSLLSTFISNFVTEMRFVKLEFALQNDYEGIRSLKKLFSTSRIRCSKVQVNVRKLKQSENNWWVKGSNRHLHSTDLTGYPRGNSKKYLYYTKKKFSYCAWNFIILKYLTRFALVFERRVYIYLKKSSLKVSCNWYKLCLTEIEALLMLILKSFKRCTFRNFH